ncbi:ATP-binding cassette subfamily B protein [Amycolatopsis bartoniae]|uniref:ABC transporter ATP-binding protein n=1 Tax=Amycolatopsis bartoniae TaxID=941986 RepID=A0A8H9J0H6_9PSEU|nr:ABC transporter ATP-binding protein [Amycolatopsis bartoniae]MBB2939483.1 ATP-binding cassette subfamily B protein [Amycolatopsis bartoniae]TVT11314.1 ABC transporter ATP-binding protein [Amycolatopsis bartoniae]GHF66557.1 ABC transporter ATP-binding protein [Amycolatopsis bartoniae]
MTASGEGSFTQYQAFRFAWSVLSTTDRWRFVGKQLSGVALGLLGAVPPLLVRMLLDSVLPGRDFRDLALVVGLGALVYLLLAVAGVADQWLQSRITEGLGLALRERFFAKTLRLPFAFFVHSRSGSLASRLTVDIRTAQRILQSSGSAGASVIGFAVTLGIMLWLSPVISLVVLAVMPFVVLADRWFAPRIAEQSRRQLGANAQLTSFVVERLNAGGALFIRTSGEPAREAAAFGRRSHAVWRYGIRAAVLSRAYYGILAISSGLGILAVLYLGGRQAIQGQLQLGTLVALAQYAGQSYQPVTRLARTRMQILGSAVALGRLKAYFETPETVPGAGPAPGTRERADERAVVELDRVWFRYPEVRPGDGDGDLLPVITGGCTPWILRDVSLRARPGDRIAIVGESGAGKTSIGYLLAGLFRPIGGTVRLFGADLADLPPVLVRGRVGLVSQEAFLFSGSIVDNIRHGRPDASADEVARACAAAGIDETIAELPQGYRTIVGERGFRLSGGQKQRISLARALLCGADVVVLDEATSHLDAVMDERIQRDLLAAKPGRVLVVVAHRLSTVMKADEILVLRDGRFVERGRHDELTARDGYYAALFRTQRRIDADPLVPRERKPA